MMRYPCSEKILIDKLKEALQKESGTPAGAFDSALQWWIKTCGITLSGSSECQQIDPVKVADLREKMKLPSELFRRFEEEEQRLGVRDLRIAARRDGWYSERVSLRITGEVETTQLDTAILLFVMAFNTDNEMIGYNETDFRCKYDGERASFDFWVHVPEDEILAALDVRCVLKSSWL